MKGNRLFRILYYILDRERVTARELSEKFEVSVRTVYRDIDDLSAAGIPVYALQGKGGGIEIDRDFVLSRSLLTEREREEIMAALHGLKSTGNSDQQELLTKLSALFRKKYTNWIEVDFGNWGSDRKHSALFEILKSAILHRNPLNFTYFSSREEETVRTVKPVRILFKEQDWYLYAFCLLRNDFRYFKLSRIRNLKLIEETFDDNFSDLVLEKEVPEENTVRIRVKFDRNVAFRVYDELNDIIEDEEGNLYADIEIPNDFNLYHYVFSYGDGAEILEPREIRERVREMVQKMSEKYGI